MQAPCRAVDAVLVAVESHQRVVGQGADDGAFQVAGQRQQGTLAHLDTQHDVLVLQVEVDV